MSISGPWFVLFALRTGPLCSNVKSKSAHFTFSTASTLALDTDVLAAFVISKASRSSCRRSHWGAPISALPVRPKVANISTFVLRVSTLNTNAFFAPVVVPVRWAPTSGNACVQRVATADVLVVAANRREHIWRLQTVGLVNAGLPQTDVEVLRFFLFTDGLEQLEGAILADS